MIGSLSFFLMFGILKDCESFTGRSLVSGVTLWLLLRLHWGAKIGPLAQQADMSHC